MPQHTVGALAHILGESTFRVRNAIKKAGVECRGRAGNYRLYADEDLPAIRHALAGMGRMLRPVPPGAEAR